MRECRILHFTLTTSTALYKRPAKVSRPADVRGAAAQAWTNNDRREIRPVKGRQRTTVLVLD